VPETAGMNVISGKQEDAVTLPETVTDSICKTITERESLSGLMHLAGEALKG
jgi:hypothetical protein